MRTCTKCGIAKPLGQFPPVRRGKPALQTWCRECFAAANAANYAKNREREKARLIAQSNARRAELRRQIVAYLREHPCVDCGETDIVVLEFDHVGAKTMDVTTLANSGRSWRRVLEEIEACVVRCANCHRKRTATSWVRAQRLSRQPLPVAVPPRQLFLMPARAARKCRRCGKTKPAAEFPFRSIERQTIRGTCLECQREISRNWYEANRSRQIASARRATDRRYQRLWAFVRSYLLAHPCIDCGETDPTVLEFDHRRDKLGNVSDLVRNGRSLTVIEAEIRKCEVRCANCHRRRTAIAVRAYRVGA
jgi:hypothetical protein